MISHPVKLSAAVIIAAVLAFASSMIERYGPDHGVYCALGKINGIEVYCPKLKLNGGWPAPFMYDQPGVSVEGQLFIAEDDFRGGPYIANISFYFLILLGLDTVATWLWRRRKAA